MGAFAVFNSILALLSRKAKSILRPNFSITLPRIHYGPVIVPSGNGVNRTQTPHYNRSLASLPPYECLSSRQCDNRDHEFEAFQQKEGKGAGAILLGRKTYAIMQQFWPTPMATQMIPEVAAYMNTTPKLVVSHTAFTPEWENTTIIHTDVVEQLRRYKAEAGDDIIILGSNNLGVALLPAGLIDEVQLVLNPVVLGGGIPLFAGLPKTTELTLKDTRRFQSGKLLLVYGSAVA